MDDRGKENENFQFQLFSSKHATRDPRPRPRPSDPLSTTTPSDTSTLYSYIAHFAPPSALGAQKVFQKFHVAELRQQPNNPLQSVHCTLHIAHCTLRPVIACGPRGNTLTHPPSASASTSTDLTGQDVKPQNTKHHHQQSSHLRISNDASYEGQ
jgi:hypothetical protein